MNITHTKWDTFIRSLTFKDWDWAAIDITSDTITISIKKNIDDSNATITDDATIDDWPNWLASFSIAAATMDIAIWVYYYDIQWTNSSSVVTTVAKWTFTITYEITN